MTTSFAIALAQLNPRLGDVASNCDRLAKARGEAAKNGAAVIVTPEMYLSGYPCDDLVLRDDFMRDVAAGIDRLGGTYARERVTWVQMRPVTLSHPGSFPTSPGLCPGVQMSGPGLGPCWPSLAFPGDKL